MNPWLSPYDWMVWAALLAMAFWLLRRDGKLPAPLIAYLTFDILRDVVLVLPAMHADCRGYAEIWWTFKYGDYLIKIWLLCWAALRVIWPIRMLTLMYAVSGTLTLMTMAWRIGLPWQRVDHHDVAMLVLHVATMVLCCFLGLYIVFLSDDWPQPESGLALGVLAWAVAGAVLGWLQLHGHNTARIRRGYPLAEMAMLAGWWQATGRQAPVPRNKRQAPPTDREDLERHIAASQRRWASRQAMGQ